MKLLLSLTVLFLANHAPAQIKIATVDLNKVLTSYHKTKQAEEVLKAQGLDLEKAQKGMVEDYKKASEDYKKLLDSANNQAVAREERERCQKAAEGKLLALKDLELHITQQERQAQVTFDEQKRRVMENLLREIRAAVAAKAKAGNFGLVLDSSIQAASPTSVLYASSENDLTEEILKQLNAGMRGARENSGEKKEK